MQELSYLNRIMVVKWGNVGIEETDKDERKWVATTKPLNILFS